MSGAGGVSSVSSVPLAVLAAHLDLLLRTHETPDYPHALNGVQVEHCGPVRKIAAAVDVSARTIRAAVDAGANLILVHHGLFWGGLKPLTGPLYERVRLLLEHDVALYSAHLPLDVHEVFGNSRLLSRELGLDAAAGFARFENVQCGVRGASDITTADLLARLRSFAHEHGGSALATTMAADRRTRRWAICSGAGANAATLSEAVALGVDTLITGEGPHWSAVDAEESGLVIIYAGHYATETPGVRAVAQRLSVEFDLPWVFVAAPSGL